MKLKTASVICLCIAVLFLLLGLTTQVPEKKISFFNFDDNGYESYVGGDAYNFIIEAALRGGQISGATSARATYIAASGILFAVSFFGLAASKKNEETVESLNSAVIETETANLEEDRAENLPA